MFNFNIKCHVYLVTLDRVKGLLTIDEVVIKAQTML